MCTPFDEESVPLIQQMDFDAIKVASCSVTDRPLLKEVAQAGMPVVASTGGASIQEIEYLVYLFQQHGVEFALEHCVSVYPTPHNMLQLNQIEYLNQHFNGVPIGWSTHENPDDLTTIQIAVAKGSVLFERHVGIENEGHTLNDYSSTPEQIRSWISAYKEALDRCGAVHRPPASNVEKEALQSLMRGVYVNRDISKDQIIGREDVFFAMPILDGCLLSGKWKDGFLANRDYVSGQPLDEALSYFEVSDGELMDQFMLQVRGMLRDARIQLNAESKVEISHHYGLKRFREFGAVIVDVINREYCKKLIIQLPRQKHPYHYHKKKEETFQVLYGSMEVEKDGNPTWLVAGDIFLVEPQHWHKFSTLDGVIFEEISTTHYDDDSYYQDDEISRRTRQERKTRVEKWTM